MKMIYLEIEELSEKIFNKLRYKFDADYVEDDGEEDLKMIIEKTISDYLSLFEYGGERK